MPPALSDFAPADLLRKAKASLSYRHRKPNSTRPALRSDHVPDPNEHIRAYLSYYINFKHAPHYAVLLTGRWGIGKTFLVRQILDAFYADKPTNYIYVSLYGLSSMDELERALTHAIYPILDSKLAVVGSKATRAALGLIRFNPDLKMTDFTSKFANALYVFDDLERCALPVQRVMGYINEFVEHDDCKVVVIANEEAIRELPEYRERREKTVGKVLEVQSSVHQALQYFITEVEDSPTASFLDAHVEHVIAIFHLSELDNLRILQQTLWDFERLFTVIDPERKRNAAAMKKMLGVFLALSFEVKAGRLIESDVKNRLKILAPRSLRNKGDNDAPPQKFEAAVTRYDGLDLTDGILVTNVLIDIIFKGIVRPHDVETSLAISPYFSTSKVPPWRIVWDYLGQPEEAYLDALTRLEAQYAQHEIVVLGEVLHVFGLRLWASDAGLISFTRAEVMRQNIAYVDYLYESGALASPEPGSTMSRFGGYGGLEVFEKSTADFRTLYDYISAKRDQATKDRYPMWGRELLGDMVHDTGAFFNKLALHNNAPTPFYATPVLASIAPKEFVSTLMAQAPRAQKEILMSLHGRYEHGALEDQLKDELPWLMAVRDEVMSSIDKAVPLTKVRIKFLLENFVDEHLPSAAQQT